MRLASKWSKTLAFPINHYKKISGWMESTPKLGAYFVNERFAVFLLINECIINCVSKKLDKEGSKKFDEYIDYVLYYFKYREYNAQVIELIIESFKMGIEFDKKKC